MSVNSFDEALSTPAAAATMSLRTQQIILDRMEGAVEHLRDIFGQNRAPDIAADRITA